jgi:hypothetical protein
MLHLSKQSPSLKKGDVCKYKCTNSVLSAEDCTNFLIAGLAAGSTLIIAGSAPAAESESATKSTAKSIAESKSSPQPEPSKYTSPPPTDTAAAMQPIPNELLNHTPGAPLGIWAEFIMDLKAYDGKPSYTQEVLAAM